MLYVICAWFRPNVENQRQELHESFNAHIAQRHPRVRLGGPLRDDSGARSGVLILAEAEDREQVDRFVNASPYAKAGLYQRIDIAQVDVEVGTLG